MRIYSIAMALVVAALAIAAASPTWAKGGKYNEVLSIGEKGPDFSAIPGIDDKKHGLAEYQDAKRELATRLGSG